MNNRHYYAMHTPYGDITDTDNIPVGTILIFDGKKMRDEWVEDNYYNTRNGNKHQTKAITEHEARVTMLRQCGREMLEHHNRNGLAWPYRDYAQYCPTAVMARDYTAVIGADY